jgi:hypothetical protein
VSNLRRTDRQILAPLLPHSLLHERQFDLWRRQVLGGPTQNATRTRSNDFPGLYAYEPRSQTEHLMVLGSNVDWSRVQSGVLVLDGQVWLGYWSEEPFEAEVTYEVRPRAQERERWDALRTIVGWCLERLRPAEPVGPAPCTFERRAENALAALDDREGAWFGVNGLEALRMYVAGTSEAWGDVDVDHVELLCQIGVAWGLGAAISRGEFAQHSELFDRLLVIVGQFYRPDLHSFSNTYPLAGNDLSGGNVVTRREGGREATNVWYHLFNLARLLEVTLLEPDVAWRANLQEAVDHTVALAARTRYLFPLFWWLDTGEQCGAVSDFASAGAFAWAAVRAAEVFDEPAYLEHAARALETLHQLPFDYLHAEAMLLPRAAWAAHRLLRLTGAQRWADYRDDFVAASLRQMYWTSERFGMFNACAGMCYPAFFENIQVLLAFDEFLDDTPFPLASIRSHQLARNSAFFPDDGPGLGVPMENLWTVEYPFAGRAGKEIYGIGETLWQHYLARGFES